MRRVTKWLVALAALFVPPCAFWTGLYYLDPSLWNYDSAAIAGLVIGAGWAIGVGPRLADWAIR